MEREIWTAAVAHHLQRRWRTVDPVLLEEVAGDLWGDQRLRERSPSEAAQLWLAPLQLPRRARPMAPREG